MRRQTVQTLEAPGRSLADADLGGCGLLTQPLPILLVLDHLMVRDSLAGHRDPSLLRRGGTVSPTTKRPRPAALTGQDSCRQPARIIVAEHPIKTHIQQSSKYEPKFQCSKLLVLTCLSLH
jgi:hypothetical protein